MTGAMRVLATKRRRRELVGKGLLVIPEVRLGGLYPAVYVPWFM